jgi:cellulose synthase (UDP-forming)
MSKVSQGILLCANAEPARQDSCVTYEIWLTRVALGAILVATAMTGIELWPVFAAARIHHHWATLAENFGFVIVVAFLIYGGLVYGLTRLNFLQRISAHEPRSDATLDTLLNGAPSLAILIPSYKEDERVIYQTLMSAALQDYPNRRVVLLIDDLPHPATAADYQLLARARALPQRIIDQFADLAGATQAALNDFQDRAHNRPGAPDDDKRRLLALYQRVLDWFERRFVEMSVRDHTDILFRDKILAARRAQLIQDRDRWLAAWGHSDNARRRALCEREFRRLAAAFDVHITSFERKQYVNLSHESNKAMNLNSYIGLMGGAFNTKSCNAGRFLEKAAHDQTAEWQVPDADYIITLDADSLLVGQYASRLIYEMERPEHARTAVMQTPYSAVPEAKRPLERIAGATTDIQYLIHQGFTGFNATYWVGANALLRKKALADIAFVEYERGYPVTRFIQDRTVIEDTESSIDLILQGWRLHNYPDRLAYSATPPDFGSLIIQRRRWANGGLIILPKLLRYIARQSINKALAREAFMRFHYLVSIAAVNLGLLFVLAVPLNDAMSSVWLPMTALPYFLLYGRDLVRIGYRWSDLVRVYAINLLLLPVNLGGVAKSLQQAWTKRKIPFGRTPKVQGRTATPPWYLLAAYGLVVYWFGSGMKDCLAGYWAHGFFALLNSAMLAYALSYFVGWRETVADLRLGLAPLNALRRFSASRSAVTTITLMIETAMQPVMAPDALSGVETLDNGRGELRERITVAR